MKKVLLLLILINSVFLVHSIEIEIPPKGVSIHLLDNGIKVLLIENPALPMVGINTVVKVGSAYETYASSGMSHMLEHLLFNGTTQWTQKQLYDMSDKIGGYNNANTSDYYTNYMMVTPADKIKTGMEIQAGMLFDSVIPESKFEKEKGIVLEEIAKSLVKPSEHINRSIRQKIYSGHALSLPTLGTYETIKGMSRDKLYTFYKNNYVPNNMEISVIGNFNSKKMLGLLNDIYGKQQPGDVLRTHHYGWSTGFDTSNHKQFNQNVDYVSHPGKEIIIQNFYPILNNTNDFHSLLEVALNTKLNTIKTELLKQFPDQIKSLSFKTHNQPVAQYLQADLNLNNDKNINEIAQSFNLLLKSQTFNISENYLKSESIKSRTAFLKQIEKPHMFGIYNADLIAKKGVGAIFAEFSGTKIKKAGADLNGFQINSNPMILIQLPENGGSKENEQKITTQLFENGDENAVIIAKQNSSSDLLAIHYLVKYKHQHESQKAKDAALLWHDIFGKRMKSETSQSQISQYGLSFTVNDIPFIPMDDIYLSPTFGYIRVEGLATDIKDVIDFLNQQMLTFTPTEKEFNQALEKFKNSSSMSNNKNPSKKLLDKHIDENIYTNKLINFSELPDYNQFLTFGKNYFNPNNMIISVVSKESVEQINQYYKNFSQKSKPLYTGLAHSDELKSSSKSININESIGGEQANLFYGFVKNIDIKDKAALSVLSLILRDNIIFNIRETQGLAYRMSAGIDIQMDKALFYIKLPTQPKNIEVLDKQLADLFNSKFAQNLKQQDVEKTINKYLGKMMFRRLSSINQAYYLAHSYYFHGNINQDENNLNQLANVTLDDVKAVAKKYLKNTHHIKIIIN